MLTPIQLGANNILAGLLDTHWTPMSTHEQALAALRPEPGKDGK
jgi:hypothetical protein